MSWAQSLQWENYKKKIYMRQKVIVLIKKNKKDIQSCAQQSSLSHNINIWFTSLMMWTEKSVNLNAAIKKMSISILNKLSI